MLLIVVVALLALTSFGLHIYSDREYSRRLRSAYKEYKINTSIMGNISDITENLAAILTLVVIGMLLLLIVNYAVYRDELITITNEREAIEYRLATGDYTDELARDRLITDIASYNESIERYQYTADSIWIGMYTPRFMTELEKIPLELVG